MAKLIIITGDLAAGKSTVASSLSLKLKTPCLIKDDVKEIGCDIIGFSNREENRAISKAAVSLMIYFFKQVAKTRNDLILEGNFRAEELDELLSKINDN